MKTSKHIILLALLSLLSLHAYCDWGDTKGYFKGQKDIEGHLSDNSDGMATIAYNGKLWNFVNYNQGESMVVRILTNSPDDSKPISWDCSKNDPSDSLKGFSDTHWQPAPVVFDEALYLFVYLKDGSVGYSTYDLVKKDWRKIMPGPSGCRGNFMSAVVIYDKLYLLARRGNTNDIAIYWTATPWDETSWQTMETDAAVGDYTSISAITKSYKDTDLKIKSKLQFAYITAGQNARFAEYQIDSTAKPVLIRNIVISDSRNYCSVALAEGSVMADPESDGFCTQAFLKKDSKDNGYCRYRIIRCQLKDGGDWTEQENNLVKQNYLWASHSLTLTAANFPVMQADSTVKQYMCVIYRGYDDWNNPLNCAWAETDHLNYLGEGVEQKLAGVENTQYIGYIEGPPPFYLNHPREEHPNDAYLNKFNKAISVVKYDHSETQSTETVFKYDVGGKIKSHFAGFKQELGYSFGQTFGSESRTTIEQSVNMFANKEHMFGWYIGNYPVINYMKYQVCDTKGNPLYPTYYFFITRVEKRNESVDELSKGLVIGQPTTYMNRKLNISKYNSFGSNSASWLSGMDLDTSIEVESEDYTTNTQKASLKLEKGFLHLLEVEIEGSFEYEMTTKSIVGDKVTCFTALNEAVDSTDITQLDFNIYWICPTKYQSKWWVKEGSDPSQNTWCLTYEVTYISYKNGLSFGQPGLGEHTVFAGESTLTAGGLNEESGSFTGVGSSDLAANEFSLAQNYPNPFRSVTTIRYQVGSTINPEGTQSLDSQVTLLVSDLTGKVVAMLVDQRQAPGKYEITWDASGIPPGLYFYSLNNNKFRDFKKMMILK